MSVGRTLLNPLSPLSSMNLDPKMLNFQTSIFEVLMESVLKMSNVMDLKVFILFEDVEKKRHFGGHEDLCDLYNDGILEAQKGDIELAAGKTDLRIVHKSEGVRGRLYDHQPTSSTAVPAAPAAASMSSHASTPILGGNPALSAILFSASQQPQQQQQQQQQMTQQQQPQQFHQIQQIPQHPQQPYRQQQQQHSAAEQQQIVYQQLYQQLQSILLPASEHQLGPPTSILQPQQQPTHQQQQQRTSRPSLSPPSAPSVHSMSTRYPRAPSLSASALSDITDPDNSASTTSTKNVSKPHQINTCTSSSMTSSSAPATFADESGVKMSKRNILMADLEEESIAAADELDDAASDLDTSVVHATSSSPEGRKRAGSKLGAAAAGASEEAAASDPKVPKIDETYVTDAVIEQKIKKIEEDIGYDIAKEYHDSTKHLLANLRQPRQPNTPLTASNFDGRMQQIVAKHHASQIIVHPPVGSAAGGLKNNPMFQQPKVIYQNRVMALPTQGRALAPKPAPSSSASSSSGIVAASSSSSAALSMSRYPGPTTTTTNEVPVLIQTKPASDPPMSTTPGYTTIILRETKPASVVNAGSVAALQAIAPAPVTTAPPSNKPRIIVAPASAVGRSVAAKKIELAGGSMPLAQPTTVQTSASIVQGVPLAPRGSGIVGTPVGLFAGGQTLMTMANPGVVGGAPSMNHNHIGAHILAPSTVNVTSSTGPIPKSRVGDMTSDSASSSASSSSSKLLSSLADGIVKSGLLNSNDLNDLGPQLEASIKAVVAGGIPSSTTTTSTASTSATNASSVPSSTAITSSSSNVSAASSASLSSLSTSAVPSNSLLQQKQQLSSSDAGGGTQAELMMRLYQTLAEVVFGSSSSSSSTSSTSTTTVSSSTTTSSSSSTTTSTSMPADKGVVSVSSQQPNDSVKGQPITQNGVVVVSSSSAEGMVVCTKTDEDSISSLSPPDENMTNSSPSDSAAALTTMMTTTEPLTTSADLEDGVLDRTNDVGSPASTASADGSGTGGSLMGQTSSVVSVMGGGVGASGLGEGDNVCHICQYRFRRISHLRQHIQEVHEKERRFSCDLCNRLFKRAEHLRKHLRTVHKGATPAIESAKKDKNDCIVLT